MVHAKATVNTSAFRKESAVMQASFIAPSLEARPDTLEEGGTKP